MTRHWKLAAAGLAAAAVVGWGITRREASSRPGREPVPVAAPVASARPPAPEIIEPPAKAPPKPAAAPVRPAAPRGAGLLEKGEALGGTAP